MGGGPAFFSGKVALRLSGGYGAIGLRVHISTLCVLRQSERGKKGVDLNHLKRHES
jgi:hypothetical protein